MPKHQNKPKRKRPALTTLKPKITTIDTRKAGSPGTGRITGRKAMAIRERILERDGYVCAHCKRLFSPDNLEIDHTVPLHLGGAESDENRQALCVWCHAVKTEQEEKERNNAKS